MIKTTTPNDVILNVYREAGEQSQKEFEAECLLNSLLFEEREEIEALRDSLENLSFQPKRKSIENILAYSQSFMKIQ